jgi:hypothetical protein
MRHRGVSIVIAILVAGVFAAGCDNQHPTGPSVFGVGPSAAPDLVAAIQPAFAPLTPLVGACPLRQPFTSAFDLVIQSRSGMSLFLDQVTFHFLDGSNVTSQPVGFSRPELTRLFPTIAIPARTSGIFPFRPQFGCGIGVPQALIVDLILTDAFNGTHPITTRVGMR